MTKRGIIACAVLWVALAGSSTGGEIERNLRDKGLHVADLSDQDKITLQVNRLEQAFRLQWTQTACNALSPDYVESDLTISPAAVRSEAETRPI